MNEKQYFDGPSGVYYHIEHDELVVMTRLFTTWAGSRPEYRIFTRIIDAPPAPVIKDEAVDANLIYLGAF